MTSLNLSNVANVQSLFEALSATFRGVGKLCGALFGVTAIGDIILPVKLFHLNGF